MTPKEKANQILDKYKTFVVMWTGGVKVEEENVRQCALIAVNEVIEAWEYIDVYLANGQGKLHPNLRFWYEVKKLI